MDHHEPIHASLDDQTGKANPRHVDSVGAPFLDGEDSSTMSSHILSIRGNKRCPSQVLFFARRSRKIVLFGAATQSENGKENSPVFDQNPDQFTSDDLICIHEALGVGFRKTGPSTT